MVKSIGLGGDWVGVREDFGDISGEVCWDRLSSLHALEFDIFRKVVTLSRRTDNEYPDVCSECRKGMPEAVLCLFVHKESYSAYITVFFVHE